MQSKVVRINTEALFQKKEEYQIELQNRFEVLSNEDTSENDVEKDIEIIKQCAEDVAGKRRKGETRKAET